MGALHYPIQFGPDMAGYTLEFYEPGGTTTPKKAFVDAAATDATSFLTLTLGSNGLGTAFLKGKYYIRVLDTASAEVKTWDNVTGSPDLSLDGWVDYEETLEYLTFTGGLYTFKVKGANVESRYPVGRWLKLGGTAFSEVITAVESVAYSAPDTTITCYIASGDAPDSTLNELLAGPTKTTAVNYKHVGYPIKSEEVISGVVKVKNPQYFYNYLERYGAVGDGDGAGGGTDDSAALQAAFDAFRNLGGRLTCEHAKIFRCDSAVTLQSASTTVENWNIDFNGATFDFQSYGPTSGDLFTYGATTSPNGHDKEQNVIRNLSIIGPEPAITTLNTTTVVGLKVINALNCRLENIKIRKCYKGVHATSSWHVDWQDALARECYIGWHLDDALTFGTFIGCESVDNRYGILIQPTSGTISGQTLISFRNEGNDVGIVIDPNSAGSSIGITDINFIAPYFENITYDLVRAGLQWTFANPDTRPADASNYIANLQINGGHWSGGAYTATHAPLVLHSSGNVRGGQFAIPARESDVVGDLTHCDYVALIDGNIGVSSSRTRSIAGQSTFNDDVTLAKGIIDSGGTFTDTDATPSVASGSFWLTGNTTATTITNFDGGRNGMTLHVLCKDSNTTVANNSTIKTSTGESKRLTSDILYTFKRSGGIWYEQGQDYIRSTTDVSNPPTDAELDAAFGTPAAVGIGFSRVIDDAGADSNVYLVYSNGTSWWYLALTKSV